MAKPRQSKADILAAIERRRIETAAARREAMRLESTGAEARVCEEKDDDGKTQIVVRARRIDVFQLLLERGAIPQDHFNAVRDHESDLATAMGFNTPERRPDHIRASVEGAPGQNVTQAMIEADRRVQWVQSMLTTRDAALLKALLQENDANCGRWRGTVERITGESREEAHAVAIRCMAANLRDVRDRFQRPPVAARMAG
jgi:hypothetical protein